MVKYRFEQIAINSTEKKKPVEEDRFTYLGLEHLDSGSLKVTRFGSEVAPIGEKLVMHKGDVLFGKRRAYQKKVAIAPFDGIFSAHGMVLRPREDVIDKSFFPLFISSDYFLDAAIKISVGSLSPTINWRDLKTLEFELPDLATQRKLAETLWSINETMEAYKKLISATDELVKSQFMEQFGTPDSSPFEVSTIGNECRLKSGTTFSSDKEQADGEFLYAKVADMNLPGNEVYITTSSTYVSADTAGNTFIEKGAVIFPKRGGAIGTNKKRILCRDTCVDLNTMGVIPGKRIKTEYLYVYFLRMDLASICDGSTIPQLNNKNVSPLRIIVPPVDLQEQFASFVRQSDKSKFAAQSCSNLNFSGSLKRKGSHLIHVV